MCCSADSIIMLSCAEMLADDVCEVADRGERAGGRQ